MIRDRYDPVDLFALVPQWHLQFEPELAELDRLLTDDRLFQEVKADLARRYSQSTRTGRPSTPVEVLLRLLIVKQLYGWSYEQTEQFVNDSIVLRQFCRVYLAPVPDDTTLLRWARPLTVTEGVRADGLARRATVRSAGMLHGDLRKGALQRSHPAFRS